MNAFAEEFENLCAAGLSVQCFDALGNAVLARQALLGGYSFDDFGRAAEISIDASSFVTISGPSAEPFGGHDTNRIGSVSDNAPLFRNEETGTYVWIVKPTAFLRNGRYEADDSKGQLFTVRVHGDGPHRRLILPPSKNLKWIRPFSHVVPPPNLPAWANALARGIVVA